MSSAFKTTNCSTSIKVDLFVVTETWLMGDERYNLVTVDLANSLTDFEYTMSHMPIELVEVCVNLRKGFKVTRNECSGFASFEHNMDITVTSGGRSLRLSV